ncbi:hypothetical protein OCU04_008523 [Sclerotinia nivalis]|uniref:Carrier domain-containing protein n=1 Tax=Sclerotinia nivalis TaxID=352851 RepID=A0A9X0AJB0_9HELO|nr:hypothetical protein OCU04_008523 [Sclerotinia nivalis]
MVSHQEKTNSDPIRSTGAPYRKPVAVCGIALRLPGGINSVETLWDTLRNGHDMRGPIPYTRYNVEGFSDTLGNKGSIKTRHGYFLDQDPASFDSSQSTLTEDEVKKTDPQQRLLLEVVKECFENAGETAYRGENIGCYVGTFAEDWLQSQAKEDQHSGGYIMSGQVDMMLANRVSYENDLRGPSMVIKTGCSASLIALHEACRALQMDDCDGAIVAGANLILGPTMTAAMSAEGILSPEGSCKTFDSAADGFARGEAVTAVYVQLLETAVQKGLPIRAVITNTGVNCDGRSQGLLKPSTEAQVALMRKVHGDIGSDPQRTAFIECHGTGTPTGDPIEAAAIGQVFGEKGVYIGSIKPNVGHSEGSSGISSLIKSIVMLEKGIIVPNIKFSSPNPKIEFERYGLKVPQELTPWPIDRDLRIAVNSFGIGGSNVHVIVEHPYTHISRFASLRSCERTVRSGSPLLLLMSASSSSSLSTLSARYREYVKTHRGSLPNLAYTFAHHREYHQHRTYAVCGEEDQYDMRIAPTVKVPAKHPGVTMIFSGQGAQWAQMGRELLYDQVKFRETIRRMDTILQSLQHPPAWSIEAELDKPLETSKVNRAEISQPLCTALQIAIFNMLNAAGVQPSAVVGHSSGEIAAAYATGAIGMEEAIIIAYYRGFVTTNQKLKGAMAAVGLGSEEVSKFLKPGVVIACENSPDSTTISGDEDVILDVIEEIKSHQHGILARRLKVDIAYHSPHMKPLSSQYRDLMQDELKLRSICRKNPSVPMFSSVWGEKIVSAESLSTDYWVSNLVSPVRFNAALKSLLGTEGLAGNILLEIGPHSTLAGPLRQICATIGAAYTYFPTLVRSSHSTRSILAAFGMLYQHGFVIDWHGLIPEAEMLTDLPPYPWNHATSYWYESRVTKAWRSRIFGHHELLGLRVPYTTDLDPVWRIMISLEDVPWLVDHKVKGDVVFPFASYVSMAGEAFRQVTGIEDSYSVYRTTVLTAIVLDEEKPLEVVTSLHSINHNDTKNTENVFEFTISSYRGSTWIQHCKGSVGRRTYPISDLPKPIIYNLPRQIIPTSWYEEMARLGLAYGPIFRRVERLATSTTDMIAAAKIWNESASKNPHFVLHPATIDASFQVGLAALTKGLCRNFAGPQVPTFIEELQVSRGSINLDCTASCSSVNGELSIESVTSDGSPCLRLHGLRLVQLADDVLLSDKDIYGAARLEWVTDYDFQPAASLVKIPTSSNAGKQIIEELALLCVVESRELLRDLKPSMPHLVKYRAWLEKITDEALADKHPVLENTSVLVSLSADERFRKIEDLTKVAYSSPLVFSFVEAIMRIRNNIQQIFTGSVDTLELLLRENALAHVYDAVSFDYGDFICALSDTVPDLRILEIGAGTGGTTELILRGLQNSDQFPQYSKYTFTDISAGFFPKARERFANAMNMEFKVFDISRDPLSQGFEPNSYDLILAANVVHATPSLSQTLQNLQPLLLPRGQLVLTEFCTSFRAPNYIYGNFSGWWLGESDNRKWEPYVNIDRWDNELKAAGFSGANDIVLDATEPYQYCATIVAQKLSEEENPKNSIAILCEKPEASFNQTLREYFRQNGYDACFLALHHSSRVEGDCIASFDLEAGFFENISADKFVLFQNLLRNLGDKKLLWLMPPSQINSVDPSSSQSLGMIRTARSELDLSITTLEVDSITGNFAKLVMDVFQKVRGWKDHGNLAPDREFAIHKNLVKVGRYRPFELQQELHTASLSERYLSYSRSTENGSSYTSKLHSMPIPVTSECNSTADVPSAITRATIQFDPEATYMMTGGLGGLGRAIAVWLAERGVHNLLFLSPNSGSKPSDQRLFTELESMGCMTVVKRGLAQSESDICGAIEAAKTPIKGVIHLAMQLRDASVLDMTYDNWSNVISPKVDGAWNLHNKLGNNLDFFVMTSSLSTVYYQPGQSNYNAANTFMESFCQYRHNLGLPASVLNVCPIEDVGFVAENSDTRRKLKSQGHWFLTSRTFLEFLELAIANSSPRTSDESDNQRGKPWTNTSHIVMGLLSELPLDDPANRATWRRDRRMGLYHNTKGQKLMPTSSIWSELKEFIARVDNYPDLLSEKSSIEFLAREIGKCIFNFIMRPEEEIDISLSLAQVGLDSLMAIELRRWWKQMFRFEISVLEIMNSGTIAELGNIAGEVLKKRLTEGSQ